MCSVLYMFPIPIEIDEIIQKKELFDIHKKIDPKSRFYQELVKYMGYKQCSTVWLSKPNTTPSSYNLNEKGISAICEKYREELETCLIHADNDVFIFNSSTKECTYKRCNNIDSVALSFFVQSIQHIDPQSPMLYYMIGNTPPSSTHKGTSSKLGHCCLNHLYFHFERPFGVGSDNIKIYIGGHANHVDLSIQDLLKKWFSVL